MKGKTGGKPYRYRNKAKLRNAASVTVLVYKVSRQYVKEGMERVLNRKKRETPPVQAKVTGAVMNRYMAAQRPVSGRVIVSGCWKRGSAEKLPCITK
jgi:hypothetical protein